MPKNLKIGYLRVVSTSTGNTNTIPYSELYADKERLAELYRLKERNTVELYCGCCEENTIPLMITKNGVIRVTQNHTQELHSPSCPKSTYYESYVREQVKGISIDEETDKRIFKIALPGLYKKSYEAKESSSSSKSEPDPDKKRAGIRDLVSYVNRLAWERQTFSIKKQIKTMRREGVPVSWNYKDRDAFLRLFYGVSNDIQINCVDGEFTLYELCYKVEDFLQNDNTVRYFFCAEILKISEYKEDRKYQYITLKMRSEFSKDKATVRMRTDDFKRLFLDEDGEMLETLDGTYQMLAGWCNKASFPDKDGKIVNWINVLKSDVFYVNEYGLICKNYASVILYNQLIDHQTIFTVPYEPVSGFDELPDAVVSHRDDVDDIYLTVASEREYKRKSALYEHVEGYNVRIIKEDI